jgi:hypothetical protein
MARRRICYTRQTTLCTTPPQLHIYNLQNKILPSPTKSQSYYRSTLSTDIPGLEDLGLRMTRNTKSRLLGEGIKVHPAPQHLWPSTSSSRAPRKHKGIFHGTLIPVIDSYDLWDTNFDPLYSILSLNNLQVRARTRGTKNIFATAVTSTEAKLTSTLCHHHDCPAFTPASAQTAPPSQIDPQPQPIFSCKTTYSQESSGEQQAFTGHSP